jgi:hypothetical protein
MPLYREYSLAAQTAYAGLDDAARQADLNRSVADLPGGFAKKVVAGRAYWYYQVKSPDGKPRQSYVGPDDAPTQALIRQHADPASKLARQQLVRLGRAALELGCADIPAKHARVIERLTNAGLFSAGGILVGTHAFLSYQNMLGVSWSEGAATLDLDFAHAGRNVSLALPENLEIDTRAAIESLQMGFMPNQKHTSFKKADEPDFDLDFLTSRGRAGDEPVTVPRLQLTLQPLRFMELSLQDPVRSTLLSRSGPMVVNLPRPERYALHKLLVYGERPQAQRTKARKDVAQAAALMDYLLLHDAEDIARMWLDVNLRGPGWKRRLSEGFQMMNLQYPEGRFEARLDQALRLVQ